MRARTGDERVVELMRLGQFEQDLQEALNRRRRSQIGPADGQRDAARGIVDHTGQVISGGRALSCKDDIVEIIDGAGESRAVVFDPRR